MTKSFPGRLETLLIHRYTRECLEGNLTTWPFSLTQATLMKLSRSHLQDMEVGRGLIEKKDFSERSGGIREVNGGENDYNSLCTYMKQLKN